MAGDDDPAVPSRNARLLAAPPPDARLHVVRGGGHLFLLDEPEQRGAEIRAFLDELTDRCDRLTTPAANLVSGRG